MQFISPNDWGARTNYDEWDDRLVIKDSIAVHYGGNAIRNYPGTPYSEAKQLREWERYHMDSRGWRGIAYGYAIGASGLVYRLRGKNLYGAHLGDHDQDGIPNNSEVIPVLFIIGAGQVPTAAMWNSFDELVVFLGQQSWAASNLPVKGHREIQPKPTACPGDIIMIGIRKLKDEEEMLQRGDNGEAVKKLQLMLLAWDPNSLPNFGADGDYGGETETTVKRFQFEHGLPTTGQAGGVTVAVAHSYGESGTPGPPGPPGATPNLEDYELRRK